MVSGRRVAGWTVRGYAASLLAGLALLAIALRTVLPPGFMLAPSQDPRSLIAMTLCSGVMSEAANGVAPDLSRGQDPAGPGDGTS
ncbi:MAG: hypothetical protein EBS42_16245, partial [Caulobacteraceae bacterium]|nr:hypothetical protein [Caulobacteraceae bacterium]